MGRDGFFGVWIFDETFVITDARARRFRPGASRISPTRSHASCHTRWDHTCPTNQKIPKTYSQKFVPASCSLAPWFSAVDRVRVGQRYGVICLAFDPLDSQNSLTSFIPLLVMATRAKTLPSSGIVPFGIGLTCAQGQQFSPMILKITPETFNERGGCTTNP